MVPGGDHRDGQGPAGGSRDLESGPGQPGVEVTAPGAGLVAGVESDSRREAAKRIVLVEGNMKYTQVTARSPRSSPGVVTRRRG